MLTEVAAALVHLGLGFTLIRYFGLAGATMGFFGLYVWHGLFVYVIVRRLSGFRWSAAVRWTGVLYLCLIGAVFASFLLLPGSVATWLGTAALLIASAYSWWMVRGLVAAEAIPRKLQWLRR